MTTNETTNKVADTLLEAVADIFMAELGQLKARLNLVKKEDLKAMLSGATPDGLGAIVTVMPKPAAEPAPAHVGQTRRRSTPGKLTPENKAEMRRLRAKDPHEWTYAKLGARYGVSGGSIRNVFFPPTTTKKAG